MAILPVHDLTDDKSSIFTAYVSNRNINLLVAVAFYYNTLAPVKFESYTAKIADGKFNATNTVKHFEAHTTS